jgi:cardiolipin synthase A/B
VNDGTDTSDAPRDGALADQGVAPVPDVAPPMTRRERDEARASVRAEDPTPTSSPIAPPLPPAPSRAARGVGFARALWRIAAADASAGNAVRLLRNGDETFGAMLEAIDAARENVAFEGYIFRDDDVGRRFADALGRAAERGVTVRLLVDWVGRMGTKRAFWKALRERGVDVRIFNVPGFRRWLGLVPRDHRKLLVVDGACGVTGGIGIGNEWRTGILKRRRSPWRDTGVRVDGPAVKDMVAAFEYMWHRADRSSVERRSRVRLMTRKAHIARGGDAEPPEQGATVGVVEGEPGRLRVARALQLQAAHARRSIWIASAYFVPSLAEVEALNGAARDGVDVRVLVPSRYDHFWIRLLTRHFYRRLLANGVRVFEWRGEMMHAKTTVVDGRWTRVGSTDFNPLGVAINFELDVVIEDDEVGAAAERMFLEDLAQSREVTMADV